MRMVAAAFALNVSLPLLRCGGGESLLGKNRILACFAMSYYRALIIYRFTFSHTNWNYHGYRPYRTYPPHLQGV